MDNVFSNSFDYFSNLRKNSGFRRSKNLQAIKAQNASRISKGRPGFPKPMTLAPPKMSNRARQMNDMVRIGGTQILQNLMDSNAIRQEQDIINIYQKQIDELAKSIENKSNNLSGRSPLDLSV